MEARRGREPAVKCKIMEMSVQHPSKGPSAPNPISCSGQKLMLRQAYKERE